MDIYAIVASVLIVLALGVSLIPFIPGPVVVWAIGIIYAAWTDFAVVSVTQVVIITVLMIVGTTADLWTRYVGLKAEGSLTCLGYFATTVGAILGTIFIPVPIFGTVIGAAAGAMLVALYNSEGQITDALKAGRGVFVAWVVTFGVELVVGIVIVAIFLRAVWGW